MDVSYTFQIYFVKLDFTFSFHETKISSYQNTKQFSNFETLNSKKILFILNTILFFQQD